MPIRQDHDREFQLARSAAIEAYANVEYGLSRLFAQLMNCTPAKGSIVFFRIVNSRARNSIIGDLLEQEHGDKYKAYWDGLPADSGERRGRGLFGLIRSIDDRRNEIVHWHVIRSYGITPAGLKKHAEYLGSVVSYYKSKDSIQPITTKNLNEFTAKCEFIGTSIYRFCKVTEVGGLVDSSSTSTWQQIFQQPASYPPPDTHPLSPSYLGPRSQPRPSQP